MASLAGGPPPPAARQPAGSRPAGQRAAGGPPAAPGLLDAYGNAVKSRVGESAVSASGPKPRRGPRKIGAGPAESEIIKVITAADFEQEVVKSPVPVVVQFTADWCEPCKQLRPALEDFARKARGMVKYCVFDVEAPENAGVAAQMGIRSLPTVIGVVGGKTADQFQGLPAPPRMQQFIQTLFAAAEQAGVARPLGGDPLSDALEVVGEASDAVDEGDPAYALEVLAPAYEALQRLWDSAHRRLQAAAEAQGGKEGALPVRTDIGPLADVDGVTARVISVMARALVAEGQRGIAASASSAAGAGAGSSSAPAPLLAPEECFSQARAYADILRTRYKSQLKDDVVARGLAAVELGQHAEAAAGQLKPLLQALQSNPADHESRLQLSERLAASGQPEQAVEHLLQIIKAAPGWKGGAAKAMLLKLFDSLGSGHPVAVSGRKQLSKLLFR